jgi:hypothetical protein
MAINRGKTMTYTQGTFSIDCGPQFNGITDGRLWNGWATPLFTLETMREIQAWVEDGININPIAIEGDKVFDVYEDERTECATVAIDGVTYYAIDGWTWDQEDAQ